MHRDVKPSNVLLDENEHVYLADFGLSRRLADRGVPGEAGLSVGTPAYVAPEQIEGGDIDGRADQYALGCLLYECLTGQPPFARESELAVLWAHMQEPPPKASEHNPALPIEIDPVIATAMAKDPEQRYATCIELVEAARGALGVEQAPPRGMSRRAKAIAAAVLVAVAALAAGLTIAFGGGERPGQAEPRGQDQHTRPDQLEDEQDRRRDPGGPRPREPRLRRKHRLGLQQRRPHGRRHRYKDGRDRRTPHRDLRRLPSLAGTIAPSPPTRRVPGC